jgi:hypothetical protein
MHVPELALEPVSEFGFEAEVAEAEAAMRRSAPAGPEELDDPPLSEPESPRKPSTGASSSSWFSRKKAPSSFAAPTPANSRNSSVDPAPAAPALDHDLLTAAITVGSLVPINIITLSMSSSTMCCHHPTWRASFIELDTIIRCGAGYV